MLAEKDKLDKMVNRGKIQSVISFNIYLIAYLITSWCFIIKTI